MMRHILQPRHVGLLAILLAGPLAMIAAGCRPEADMPVQTPPEPRPAPDTERLQAPPDTEIPPNYVLLENPLPHDERSQRVGRSTYEEYCAGCHGPTGKGDGPKAAALAHKPAVLSSPRVAREASDAYLFWRISEGIPDADMPGFKGKLGGQQRWYLVNHIRAFLSPRAASGERPGRPEGAKRAGARPGGQGPAAREGPPRRAPGAPAAREGGPRQGPGRFGPREGRPPRAEGGRGMRGRGPRARPGAREGAPGERGPDERLREPRTQPE